MKEGAGGGAWVLFGCFVFWMFEMEEPLHFGKVL